MDDLHLQQVYDRLLRIEEKIDTLQEFKITSLSTVRLASMIVSGICGFLTMVVTSVMSYIITKG